MSEIDDLFALLKGSAFAPFSAAAGDPNQIPQQSAIGDGNVQPTGWYSEHSYSSFIGQSNLIDNPEMVGLDSLVLPTDGVAVDAARGWVAKYVLNSGTDAPNKLACDLVVERGGFDQPFNTNLVGLRCSTLASAAARDLDLFLYQSSAYHFSYGETLPYLTAAVRVENYDARTLPAHWTTADLYLEIVENGSVVASSSPPLALRTLDSTWVRAKQLSVSTQQTETDFISNDWVWRLRLHLVSDGSGTAPTDSYTIAEPQLNATYAPDPPPFAPLLGRWMPDRVETYDYRKLWPNLLITNGTVGYGELLFGSGDAAGDLRVTRTAAKTLEIADGGSHGPAILRIVGLRQAVPKATQTVVAGTAIVADYEVVQIDSAGNVTMTAAPTIADGVDGQMLTIVNTDTADTITLQDQGTLASSNLRLAATTVALAPRQSIQLMYSSTVGDWVQIGNKVAVL